MVGVKGAARSVWAGSQAFRLVWKAGKELEKVVPNMSNYRMTAEGDWLQSKAAFSMLS